MRPAVHPRPVAAAQPVVPSAIRFSNRARLALLACAYIPFLNLCVIVAWPIACRSTRLPDALAWLSVAWLLLVPPIVVRLALAFRPLPTRDVPVGSRAFLGWWFTSQWQTIFNRLPWIEEVIRLVPGAYSAWLRLWGSRVGQFVYWTPGLRVLDRSLLDVGDRVAFGAGVKLNPHVIRPDANGRPVLQVATIRIGSGAMVGGYSLLTPGSWIAPGEATPGRRDFRPFTGWKGGRRVEAPGGGGDDA